MDTLDHIRESAARLNELHSMFGVTPQIVIGSQTLQYQCNDIGEGHDIAPVNIALSDLSGDFVTSTLRKAEYETAKRAAGVHSARRYQYETKDNGRGPSLPTGGSVVSDASATSSSEQRPTPDITPNELWAVPGHLVQSLKGNTAGDSIRALYEFGVREQIKGNDGVRYIPPFYEEERMLLLGVRSDDKIPSKWEDVKLDIAIRTRVVQKARDDLDL